MENNKKNTSLIISIVAVVGIIAGGVYYYKYIPKENTEDNTFVVDSKILATTPKEIFLERNTRLYESKSFDEMMAISKKYDSSARVRENEELFKEANDGNKEAFFSFAQSLMVPTSSFVSTEEEVNGETATVTAFDDKGRKSTAIFIKENGEWKISEIKILQNPAE